jgi:diketogulonate reductase-like aldo/keto reductase
MRLSFAIVFYTGSSGAKILEDPVIIGLSEKYKKTPAQIVVRWCVDQGISIIPKSVKEERVKENVNVLDFVLSADDISTIGKMNKNEWCLSFQKSFYGYNPFA